MGTLTPYRSHLCLLPINKVGVEIIWCQTKATDICSLACCLYVGLRGLRCVMCAKGEFSAGANAV